jgi:NADPH:quinone reductase-like Zn-dependent oxidoreductase
VAPGGTYVLVGGKKGDWIAPFPTIVKNALAKLVGYANTRKGLAERTERDLTILRDWLADGTIRPVIDRNYKLEEGPQALAYQGTFHARGKIVVTI